MRFVIFAHFSPSIPPHGVVAISPLFHFRRKGRYRLLEQRRKFPTSENNCPPLRYKNLKKIQEVANYYGYFQKKFQHPPSKTQFFGNAAKIGFLNKLLSAPLARFQTSGRYCISGLLG